MNKRTGAFVVLAVVAGLLPFQVATANAVVSDPGVSPREVQILTTDDTAQLDDHGRLYYVEPAPAPPVGYQAPRRTAGSTTAQAGLSIPALHSRPSSTHTIFLDFDGTTLSATNAWVTTSQNPMTAGVKTGFTLDGSADFNSTEIAYIQKVWTIVAEKYSAYDVDVTTVDPGAAAYTRTSSGDVYYGDHVVITDDPGPVTEVCNNQCAGVAYLDGFDSRYNGTVYNNTDVEPAWVFSSKTFGSAQVTALDAAHEIGHTLGLSHDGDASHPSYYLGHANWVPIMGITNQNAVSQFNNGDYLGANNHEDDLAIIGANGDTGAADSFLVPDDYTTSAGAPTGPAALGDQPSYALDGVISNAADDDLFSVSRTCTSPLTATATGIGAGQAVDLRVDILDEANAALASDDPASGQTYVSASTAYEPTGMDASASLPSTTAATTYRIRVDGVGYGDPMAQTGYSAYGSIGQYHLTISGCPASGNVPDAPATAGATPNPRTTTGTVSWTAPSSDGGNPITGYAITGLPGGTVNLGNVLTYSATGLTPGTTYNLAVFAKNAVGTSATSAGTSLNVDTWAPTTKPGLTASLSGSTATLTWTAPANPGGAVLTGWHVVGTGVSAVDENLSPATLSKGYTVGYGSTSYTVTGTYTASDTAGIVASDPQAVNRSTTAPGAPAAAGADPQTSTGQATLTWTAPTSNGGSAITGYVITGLPEGTVNLGNVLAYDVSGLDPATTYPVTVAAKNAVGTGATRAYSLRADTWTPTTTPGLTVTRSGTSATLTWTAPSNPGHAQLTGWVIYHSGPGSTPAQQSVTGGSRTITGLAVGTHSFTVRPLYNADHGSAGSLSGPRSVVVTTPPSAPRIGTASSGTAGGTRTAVARWAAPSSTGGSAITGYKVIAYKIVGGRIVRTYISTTRSSAARSYAFALPAGSYRFRVVGYNKIGKSPASASSRIVTSR